MAATSAHTTRAIRISFSATENVSQAKSLKAPQSSFVCKALHKKSQKHGKCAATSSSSAKFATSSAMRTVKCEAVAEAGAAVSHRPSAAELAQTVVALSFEGTLVTLAQGGSADGEALPASWPHASHAFFALDPEGRPILLLRDCSRAAANLANHDQACLHVQVELPGQQKPQISLHGRVQKAADSSTVQKLEAAWRRRFPDSEEASAAAGGGNSDNSALYMMDVERVLVAADTNEEGHWIPSDSFFLADADPLREVASGIVSDFNREHWQDLRRFPTAFQGLDMHVEDASMIWVDKLGFDLRVLARPVTVSLAAAADLPTSVMDLRIPFPREVTEEREARSAITMMAQVAWEKERSFAVINVPTTATVEAPAASS